MNSLDLLREVLDHVEKTPELTGVNQSPHKIVYPIPFFGDIESATILTIGVNPSDGEFALPRTQHWPPNLPLNRLHGRLKNYFMGNCPPYYWFNAWIESFKRLDVRYSYKNGTAAHIDLSPRITTRMSCAPNPTIFQHMIEADIKFLFKTIAGNNNLKLIMTGGKVLGQKYIAQWIRTFAPEPIVFQYEGNGFGRTSFYRVNGLGRGVWLFSSSVGPTFKEKLVEHVFTNRDQLLEILN
jgi:hypothetical protein